MSTTTQPVIHSVGHFPRAKPQRRDAIQIKALARHRDGYRCRSCGISAREHVKKHKRGLDVHRIVPGGKYSLKNCVTLCRDCHSHQPKCQRGTGNCPYTLNLQLSSKLLTALIECARRNRRSLAMMAIVLLEEGLTASGYDVEDDPEPSPDKQD